MPRFVRMVLVCLAGQAGLSRWVHTHAQESPAPQLLLLDALGNAVSVPTNSFPSSLLPTSPSGLGFQLPQPLPGSSAVPAVSERQQRALETSRPFEWLPPIPPQLPRYLYSLDELGNTAIAPGPLFPVSPIDVISQGPKYWLSDHGFRYRLNQSFTFLALGGENTPTETQGFYSVELSAKWNVFDARELGTSGWISAQMKAKSGLDTGSVRENPRSLIGSVNEPNNNWSSRNGVRLPELAWQQSFADGQAVAIAGVVNQGNYLDRNAYAHTAYGQFLNSALVHSAVLPLAQYNPGANLQWQPFPDWYFLTGGSVGNAGAGQNPFSDLQTSHWSTVGEIGFAPPRLGNLGPGVYRIQPFLARNGGATQAGVGFNLQQQLGPDSPYGVFGRFGVGGDAVSTGARAQAGAGLVVQGPLALAGLASSREYDHAGVGLIWSQPTDTSAPVFHRNEFGIEAGYVLLLTPTLKLQPDLQCTWNRAFNPDAAPAVVIQLQLTLLW